MAAPAIAKAVAIITKAGDTRNFDKTINNSGKKSAAQASLL